MGFNGCDVYLIKWLGFDLWAFYVEWRLAFEISIASFSRPKGVGFYENA